MHPATVWLIMTTYVALGMESVLGGSSQECTIFFGPKYNGRFFCTNPAGVTYTCPKPSKRPPAVMHGCIPYLDIYDFNSGSALVAPGKKSCDAFKRHGDGKTAYIDCLAFNIRDGTKEAYRCRPPRRKRIFMEDCEILQDAEPNLGIEFYLDD
ncbi:hypothetical protein CROQUDRAFT_66198 [Cronartium quercuum f. sp. fusiforme G11]|uniref:Uncharacterized protein n=1 Tax=Cronartium quercuum f. sp. fusiforme G11 TaxID=708437 RepID=A0A9P6T9C0_9BASI|nr:hypothetical protein CROQUDRAFT_66198 [Cronartium quercuum f. sp. fusiforme G11]